MKYSRIYNERQRVIYLEMCYTTEKGVEDKSMCYKEQVKKYLEYCEFRKELDWNTLKAYRIDLKQFFEYVQEDMPEKNKIEEYITELHKKYKQKTIKRKIASIKAYYNYLEECEIIDDSPFRKIRVKFKETTVLPRVIPREEIELLLNYMYSRENVNSDKTYKYWLRDIAVVETLFATGARVYEISHIKLDCINLNTGLIKIMGKGGKERYIQVAAPEILDILKKYYEYNSEAIKTSGFFFVNSRGNRYTEQSIRLMLKKYTKLAGIKRNITPHMFRHSFATYLIEEEVDVTYVQQILGHSSIKTTQIYIHIAAKKQAEILREKHPRKLMHIVRMARAA